VLISWFILRTFGYLFYKLSKKKPRNNEKIHFYTPCVLLNPIVQEKSDQDSMKKKTKRGATCKFWSTTVMPRQTQHFLSDKNYRSSDLFDQNMSLWWQNPVWQDVARATKCRHGRNEVLEPMFSKIICRHGEKCPAWQGNAVWGKWMMTWQKPTSKESWCRHSDKNPAWQESKFLQQYKSLSSHFRNIIIR